MMHQYDQLLKEIAAEYQIRRGDNEPVENFKARIVYSALCRQAYASLFDDQTVSIEHFKDRINNLLRIYLELHPDVKLSSNLSDDIYNQYLDAGYFYHTPYRMAPPMLRAAECDGILFLRGITPDQKVYMSGAGFYLPSTVDQSYNTVNEMFAIPDRTLLDEWHELIRRAHWKVERASEGMEFLRVSPPFTNGYWKNKPDRDGSISIARNGLRGARQYYLYRFDGENFWFAQQPTWRHYRGLSNECLAARGTLPPIKYKIDGALVQLKIGYLPPPPELNLFKLYSWSQTDPSNNFNRIFDANIFFALKNILERRGYSFNEE